MIKYQIQHPIEKAFLGFQIRTAMGQVVFTSTSADDFSPTNIKGLPVNAHEWEALVVIPSHLLNVGIFELHVSSFVVGRGLLDLVTGIFFEIYDNGSFASYPFNSIRQGIILRQLRWSINNTVTIA